MADRALSHPVAALIARELDLRSSAIVGPETEIRHLVSVAQEREVPAGTQLFTRGSPCDQIYVIIDGDVELSDAGQIWIASGGASIGVIDSMIRRPYARTATARTRVRLLELDAGDFDEYLQDNSENVGAMIAGYTAQLVSGALESATPAVYLGLESPTRRPTDPVGGELSHLERLLLLRKVPALASASVQAIANLAYSARHVRLAPEQVLASPELPNDMLSILVRGQLAVRHPSLPDALVNDPIDLAAGLAELAAGPSSFTVSAVSESEVLQIHREELVDRFDEHFELARALLRHLATTQERLNDDLAQRGLSI